MGRHPFGIRSETLKFALPPAVMADCIKLTDFMFFHTTTVHVVCWTPFGIGLPRTTQSCAVAFEKIYNYNWYRSVQKSGIRGHARVIDPLRVSPETV